MEDSLSLRKEGAGLGGAEKLGHSFCDPHRQRASSYGFFLDIKSQPPSSLAFRTQECTQLWLLVFLAISSFPCLIPKHVSKLMQRFYY